MDAMVEALMPFVMFAAVLWGIEAIVTMLIKTVVKPLVSTTGI